MRTQNLYPIARQPGLAVSQLGNKSSISDPSPPDPALHPSVERVVNVGLCPKRFQQLLFVYHGVLDLQTYCAAVRSSGARRPAFSSEHLHEV